MLIGDPRGKAAVRRLRLKRFLWAGALASVSWLFASPAEARFVGFGSIGGDGDRYVIYRPQALYPTRDLPARLTDEQTGATRILVPPTGCGPGSLESGELLWHCDATYDPPFLISDLATGLTQSALRWDKVLAEPYGLTHAPEAIGRQWMTVRQTGNHVNVIGYLNWHTGTWIQKLEGNPRAQPNLDRPDLEEPICAHSVVPDPAVSRRTATSHSGRSNTSSPTGPDDRRKRTST